MSLSLRHKINLLISVVLVVVFSAGTGMFFSVQSRQESEMFQKIKALQQVVVEANGPNFSDPMLLSVIENIPEDLIRLNKGRLAQTSASTAKLAGADWVLVYDKNGNLVSASRDGQPPVSRQELQGIDQHPNGRHQERVLPDGRSLSFYYPILNGGKLLGTVEILTSLSGFDRQVRLTRWALFFSALIAICGTVLLVSFALSRLVIRPIREAQERVRDIAEGEGDLTKRLHEGSSDEIGDMARGFNAFLERLHRMVFQLAQTSGRVASASEELAVSAGDLARGAEEQSAKSAHVASAVEEMSASVVEVAKNASGAAQAAKEAAVVAQRGGEIVARTVSGMEAIAKSVEHVGGIIRALGKRSDQIGEIVSVIDEIADQTNLLALNAAIEAARAGEQGKGFAVVADEVRRLAERTGKATKEIAEMIRAIQAEANGAVESMDSGQGEVRAGVELANQAGRALTEIVGMVERVTAQVQQIAAAAEQQSTSSEEISSNVEAVATIGRQALVGVQGTAQAAGELSHLAVELQGVVTRFKLTDESVSAVGGMKKQASREGRANTTGFNAA
ncbi:MAG TPA: methyl-accepting chemotaxis protein [Methylomirabilota bacterium]|nr:methyl-accepting chemotaxis protein [Methylomirabilota bacterium]